MTRYTDKHDPLCQGCIWALKSPVTMKNCEKCVEAQTGHALNEKGNELDIFMSRLEDAGIIKGWREFYGENR